MFTYDLSQIGADTAAGRLARVRLLIHDTTDEPPNSHFFEDEELNAFLSLKGDNVYEAAALAFETWARSRAKVEQWMSASGVTSHPRAVAELLQAAENVRQASLKGVIQTGNLTSDDTGDYLEEHRPIWRDLTDYPVVE